MDKNLIQFCIERDLPFVITFDKPWINTPLEEYNTDTSAGHPAKDGDIVRYSFEKRRTKNKES